MTIDNEVKITINLSELVNIRSVFLQEDISLDEIEQIANDLRLRLTWDTLYGMVDQAILEHLDKFETHYGEIQPEPGREALLTQMEKNRKQFKMVDLVSPSWTIQVPVRK